MLSISVRPERYSHKPVSYTHLIVGGGHLEGLAQHGGNFAGDAEDALAIGTVGGDGDVKNVRCV